MAAAVDQVPGPVISPLSLLLVASHEQVRVRSSDVAGDRGAGFDRVALRVIE
ncbi:MAG: hypothetical protein J4G11_05845 [Acidimicrobiia bacterium]|nr:hypothetical protein [Acidimicrobiia bacterium]